MKRLPLDKLWEWWNDQVIDEIRLEKQYKPLIAEYEEVHRRRSQLEQLILTEEGPEANKKVSDALSRLKAGIIPSTNERHPIDVAWEVLIEAAKPMHYSELLAEIKKRGISVGGRDPGSTLIAYLGRDKRFCKAPEIKRGVWKLKEWER